MACEKIFRPLFSWTQKILHLQLLRHLMYGALAKNLSYFEKLWNSSAEDEHNYIDAYKQLLKTDTSFFTPGLFAIFHETIYSLSKFVN